MNPSADREVTRRATLQTTEYQTRFCPPSLGGYASIGMFCSFKSNKTEAPNQKAPQQWTPPKQPSAPQRETNNNNTINYTTTYTDAFQTRTTKKRRLRRHEGNLIVSNGLVPLHDSTKEGKNFKQTGIPVEKDGRRSGRANGYRLEFSTTVDQPQDSWCVAWTGTGRLPPDEVRESVEALTMKLHSKIQEDNPAAERKHQSQKASEEKGVMSEKGKMAIQAPLEDNRKSAPQPAPAGQTNKEVPGGKLQSAKNQICNNQPPPDKKGISVLKCSISLHQSFAE